MSKFNLAALAPERGANLGSAPVPDEVIVVTSAISTEAATHLRRAASAIRRVALYVPRGHLPVAQALAAELADAGMRVVLLADEDPAGSAVPAVRIPHPVLLVSLSRGDLTSDALSAFERSDKKRALSLLHDPLEGQRPAHPRDLSYQEYLRWEIARWLDTQASKFDLHWISLRSGLGQDDNKANMDTAMRMRHYQATHVHFAPFTLDQLLAGLAKARLVVTSRADVAYLALSQRVPPLLITTSLEEHAGFVAARFGDLVFEPYGFRADVARARTTQIFMDHRIFKQAMAARDETLRSLPDIRAAIASVLGA